MIGGTPTFIGIPLPRQRSVGVGKLRQHGEPVRELRLVEGPEAEGAALGDDLELELRGAEGRRLPDLLVPRRAQPTSKPTSSEVYSYHTIMVGGL